MGQSCHKWIAKNLMFAWSWPLAVAKAIAMAAGMAIPMAIVMPMIVAMKIITSVARLLQSVPAYNQQEGGSPI